MKKGQEVGNDVVHRVGNEHLIAVKLDLVTLDLDIVLDLREIKDTGKIERIIHVKMNMEERLLCHRVQGPVELVVVLVLEVCRLACPEWLYLVDDIVLVGIHIFSVLPLLLLTEYHRYGHELAVFAEQAFDALLLGILLLVVSDVKGDDSTSFSLLALLHLILRRALA